MKHIKESLIGGLSLIIAAAVFGTFFYSARSARQTIYVVGAAMGRFQSDVVKWRIAISRSATPGTIDKAYDLLKGDLRAVKDELKAAGIDEQEITIQPVNTQPVYLRQGETDYNLIQYIIVISHNIPTVQKLALNPSTLVSKGVIVQSSVLEYYFSKLADIKQKLLSDATKDAIRRAQAIADNTGLKVGPIISARAGVFQITEPYSTEISSYGVYNTATREKDITVTVHCNFELK
ncbi:MAG: SIMPL domain-containing protein [Bacteroidetes bacterium]|nr:SIMPL domain-containing protein [Bacteroidota bacterium]